MSSIDAEAVARTSLPSFERMESLVTSITEEGDFDDSAFDDLCQYEEDKQQRVHVPTDARAKHKYNVLSRLIFCWLEPLFWLGCRHKTLHSDDLYIHPQEADSERLLRDFNRYYKQGYSLFTVLVKCLWPRILLNGILLFFDVGLQVGGSVILGYITDYFQIASPSEEETRNAYLYAMGMILMGLGLIFMYTHSSLVAQKTGMMARIMTTAAVYQKVLDLDPASISKISSGHVINIASNDVQRFDFAFLFLHYLWLSPLHIAIYTYLVYQEVGTCAFVATGFVVLQIPMQFILARLYVRLRMKSALLTDRRVKIMSEVISGMRVIKMYAWEHAFKRVVGTIRRLETSTILKSSMIRAINFALFTVSLTIIMFLVFSVYTGTGGVLSPKKIFTILSLTATLRVNSIHFFVLCVLGLSEIFVAISRIQDLLDLPTVEDRPHPLARTPLNEESNSNHSESHNIISEDLPMADPPDKGTFRNVGTTSQNISEVPLLITAPGSVPLLKDSSHDVPDSGVSKCLVHAENISASWTYDSTRMALLDVSLEVNEKFPFQAIVGSVGAGKSTLLQCLLGELKPMEGTMVVKGKISYASQDPWIFSGTVRDNILFGQPFQPAWYHCVVEACALSKDMDQFQNGDLTLIGERGVTLSGGQKARINLARALYYEADIYILDDPLSAVDASVANHIVQRCIRALLKDRLVVLVTHQLQYAQLADKILGLKNGRCIAYSTPNELRARAITANTFGINAAEDANSGFTYDDQSETEDQRTNARDRRYPNRFMKGNKPDIPKSAFDRRPSVMTTLGEYLTPMSTSSSDIRPSDGTSIYSSQTTLPASRSVLSLNEEGTQNHRPNNLITFYKYFTAGASHVTLVIVLLIFLAGEGSNVTADWWISKWSTNVSFGSTNYSGFISIYGGITGAAILLNFSRIIIIFVVTINASRVLHSRMFAAVMRAPILFFDSNTLGSIVNYFSKDIGFLDDLLPFMLCEYLMLLLRCLAIVITASIANYWILFPAGGLLLLLIGLRHYYLTTAKEVKKLEADARSPLYSHISTTIQGLPTIRTFCQQPMALNTLHRYQNHHSQAWYLYLVTTRWFGMRVDILNMAFLAAVAFISISLSTPDNGSLVGLGLTYTATLTGMIQYCVRLSGEVESVMVSAERVIQYSSLEPEASLETRPPNEKPSPDWPQRGEIILDDVFFRYSKDTPLILKSLSCTIKKAEKIGIIGRTGAGKSSIIQMLFRMAEPLGKITIDGVEITSIGLHDLRKHISIIPQDPVLFSGSVRYNLDPFDEHQDQQLWDVLEQVQLKATVETLEGGLESQISEGGSNFSVGQRQLVCLARALLRKNKILILDEATANVDLKTDGIIQSAIRESFCDCTVLTIAHRLNTVMDYDRIMVLKGGHIKEMDEPYTLLQNTSSLFKVMVDRTGQVPSSKLRQMAYDAHTRRQRAITHQQMLHLETIHEGSTLQS